MEEYRRLYYNSMCNQSKFGYLDSWQFLATASHSLSFILIPLSFYGSYCIIFKTPYKMRRVKWIMLNLHVWTGILDVMLTTLITPYFFFPAACGFPVGILAVFKVNVKLQIFMGQCCCGGLFSSLLLLFENRHNSLVTSKFRIPNNTFRIIYFFFVYLYGFGLMFPAYLNEPNQIEAKLTILRTILPCPTTEFFDSPVYVLILDTNYVVFPIILYIFIMGIQLIFFVVHSFFYLFCISSKMSNRTKDLQKKFLIGVCIQVAIPIGVLLVPVIYCVCSILLGYYNQAMLNIAVLFISLHGMSATIVLIYINEPYRTFTIRLFRKTDHSTANNSTQGRRFATTFTTEKTIVF
ncbi:unnamed protein product [Caenorhabditis angaria]|uniref:Serpentine Receptor, class H n=1 Tax=Caenorhabditis angaria TaxID=860376 RepID=A0A9P1IVD5_9PELO|nr:unnamed protein product [Caenorhabditis angaria]